MDDFLPVDGDLHVLEGKAAFLAMAASAVSMLDENSFEAIQSQKAWEGLGWYTQDIELELRKINNAINGREDRGEIELDRLKEHFGLKSRK